MFTVTDLSSGFGAGAEINNLDLTAPIDAPTAIALQEVFAKRHLLILRNQTVSDDAHLRFLEALGDPVQREPQYASKKRSESATPQAALLFHSDTASATPPFATSLCALEVTSRSAPTLFANAVQGYINLPEDIRRAIEGLHGVFYSPYDLENYEATRFRYPTLPGGLASGRYMHNVQPAVRNVENGPSKSVYVSEQTTSHFAEMPGEDGEDLIQAIFEVLYREDRLYTHHWEVGDLLIWNNFALQHGRPEYIDPDPRRLRRYTLKAPRRPQPVNGVEADW